MRISENPEDLLIVRISREILMFGFRAENAVRPFTLGRKNWLFCNTQRGASASSVVYSMIETAKANGLKPFEYLQFLFETLPNTSTGNLDNLLPWGQLVPAYCRIPDSH